MLLAWGVWRHAGAHGDQIQDLIRQGATWLAGSPVGAVAALGLVALAGILMVPITLLATTVLGVFGLWPGLLVAWWGATLGALGSHAIGARVGRRALDRLPQRPVARVRRFLRRRGFWSIVLVRMLPVGNFGLSNLLAGAIGVPRRAFLFGNLVGLLPGLLGLGVLVDRARAAIRDPSLLNVVIAVVVLLLGVGVGVLLKHRLGHSRTRYGES